MREPRARLRMAEQYVPVRVGVVPRYDAVFGERRRFKRNCLPPPKQLRRSDGWAACRRWCDFEGLQLLGYHAPQPQPAITAPQRLNGGSFEDRAVLAVPHDC